VPSEADRRLRLVHAPTPGWTRSRHKITEFARQGRLQLSAQEVDNWASAVNTVCVAADKLYALLTQNQPLRNWVVADYFSPFTLHSGC